MSGDKYEYVYVHLYLYVYVHGCVHCMRMRLNQQDIVKERRV